MGNYMTSLEWSLDRQFSSYGKKDKVLTILTLLASRGGRWKPHESYPWRYLRTTLGRIEPYEAASILSRLVKANVFEVEDFKKLMNTPKMKGILKSGAPDTVFLRKFAGLKEPKDKSDTRSPRAKPDFRSAIRG
jgi:hypothetical protein